MIPDKYQRLHTLAHTDVLHRVYANAIIDMLAEVKRLQKESHARWERIQELNGELNEWREEYE